MDALSFNDQVTMIAAYGIILGIDLVIVALGWIYRKKFHFVHPRFFGLMTGKMTQEVVERFGVGIISNTIFMLPVFLLSAYWLYFSAVLMPNMAQVLSGVLIGFHLALLLISIMKLSIIVALEEKYKHKFRDRVNKSVSMLLDGHTNVPTVVQEAARKRRMKKSKKGRR